MLIRRRTGGRPQSGQVLVGVLILIAFFGVVIVAAMSFASANQIDHIRSEAIASGDSLAEGGAKFAAVNAGRLDVPCSTSPATVSTLHFANGDAIGYTPQNCALSGASSAGQTCVICALCTTCSGTQTALTTSSNVAVPGGEVDVKGNISIGNNNTLTAALVEYTGSCCGQGSLGVGTATGNLAAVDPLTSLPTPSISGAVSPTPGTDNFTPGIYNVTSFSGNNHHWVLAAGTYVIFSVGGSSISPGGSSSSFFGSGVTIYFECGAVVGGVPRPQACASGASGAGISFTGNAQMTVSPPASGPWAGVSIFYDRNNRQGFTAGGNSGSAVSGAVYAASTDMTISGNATVSSARIVVNTLFVGNSTTLSASGSGVTATCRAWELTITGTPAAGDTDIVNKGPRPATYGRGHVVVQGNCRGGSGIVDFDYGP